MRKAAHSSALSAWLSACLTLTISGWAATAGAIPPPSQRYLAETWQREQGLPQNSVNAIAQDGDGYIWAGTDDGLARFDGVRFAVFNRSNSPELASDAVRSLLPASDGGLWIATRRGLYRFARGRFTAFTARGTPAEDDLLCLHQDREGRLWIGTAGGGASSFDGRRFTTYTTRDGLAHDSVWAVLKDRHTPISTPAPTRSG